MQRHLDKGYDRVPLVVPLLFIIAKHRPTRTHLTGWMSLRSATCPAVVHRSFSVGGYHHVPDDEIMQHRRIALLELIQNIFATAI